MTLSTRLWPWSLPSFAIPCGCRVLPLPLLPSLKCDGGYDNLLPQSKYRVHAQCRRLLTCLVGQRPLTVSCASSSSSSSSRLRHQVWLQLTQHTVRRMEEESPRHLRQRLAPSQGTISRTTPRDRSLASASRSTARVRVSATSPSALLPLPEASRCDMGAQTSVSGTCALYYASATITVCFRPQHPRPRQGHGLGRKCQRGLTRSTHAT
ncbi:uncharacterized protein BDZ83DRAFT_138570 [Colletotrichum acutatum]|uniref:Uncharacterized protein n=1 Tax=Glomerella acutata TaxID=27357 RepID=A0AAD8UUZ4_GLOAC|nr:uncharacterized protein BDZ83DRAFT_138570 [Colletotrichum acutatum]KAK1728273.1 hypothetical protein BDZ83DRAFT_138570 [Colletotrichum acutatum]